MQFGLELEFGDIDLSKTPPAGCSYSTTEYDVVNSTGLAADPKGDKVKFGGEINTSPTDTIQGQIDQFKACNVAYPEATINHRLHLHCHVSYPGIRENADLMKKLLRYTIKNSPDALNATFNPHKHPHMNTSAWKYQIVDRTVMPDWKAQFCYLSNTPDEFKRAHGTIKDGSYNSLTIKRFAVNLYSIFKHGTVEFRHFFPTLDPEEVESCLEYCKRFVEEGIGDQKPVTEILKERKFKFPKAVPFSFELEDGWQKTNFKK